MNTFFPNVIKSWNGIGTVFQTCESIGIFKRNISNLIRRPTTKSIFGIHDPLGFKCLFQLRVGLSPHKKHKKCHNFASDWCDCYCAPESTYHFLLKCSLFLLQRQKLTLSISTLLVNTQSFHLIDNVNFYLYGHHSLSNFVNRDVLLSTITYIKETGRFT